MTKRTIAWNVATPHILLEDGWPGFRPTTLHIHVLHMKKHTHSSTEHKIVNPPRPTRTLPDDRVLLKKRLSSINYMWYTARSHLHGVRYKERVLR